MIEAAGQAIARAMRALRQKQPEEAEQELAEGYRALSIDRELLLLLDARSLKSQLADEEKLAMAVSLLLCDAEIQLEKGASSGAKRRLNAARRLLAEHSAPPAAVSDELERVTGLLSEKP